MDNVAKDFNKDGQAPAAKSHKIRITLTSRNVKNLEKGELTGHRSLQSQGGNSTCICAMTAPVFCLSPLRSSENFSRRSNTPPHCIV